MEYRCKYKLSEGDQVIVAAGFGVLEGAYDDAEHGTTVEFDGMELPEPYGYYYDNDTPGAEMLRPFPNHKLVLTVPTPLVRGVQRDITITKVDEAGVPVGSGDEQIQLSTNRGILTELLPSLVDGAVTIQYTPPNETIGIWLKAADPNRVLVEDSVDRPLQNP